MKFFRLEYSLNLNEIGVFTQSEHGKYGSTWDSKHSLVTFYKQKITDSLVEIPGIILQNKARLTDLISTTYLGINLVVSVRLKLIIETTDYSGIQFFPTKVYHKEKTPVDYWILNPFEFRNEFIDFSKTDVERCPPFPEKKSLIHVADLAEYYRVFEEGKQHNINHLIKSPHLFGTNIREHFFLLENVDGGVGYYVSEDLKNQIVEMGCTGVQFTELPYSENCN
jgi:hypothetical protein